MALQAIPVPQDESVLAWKCDRIECRKLNLSRRPDADRINWIACIACHQCYTINGSGHVVPGAIYTMPPRRPE